MKKSPTFEYVILPWDTSVSSKPAHRAKLSVAKLSGSSDSVPTWWETHGGRFNLDSTRGRLAFCLSNPTQMTHVFRATRASLTKEMQQILTFGTSDGAYFHSSYGSRKFDNGPLCPPRSRAKWTCQTFTSKIKMLNLFTLSLNFHQGLNANIQVGFGPLSGNDLIGRFSFDSLRGRRDVGY